MDRYLDASGLALLDFAADAAQAEPVTAAYGAGALIAPGQGTFFDEHIDLRDPEGAVFTACILAIYDAANPRKRARKALDLATHTIRIRKLLANGIWIHFHRETSSVLYFRGANSKHYRGKPKWLQHGALGEVVDALAEMGLMRIITGGLVPYGPQQASWASSYALTEDLMRIGAECGVSARSVDLCHEPAELVRLFEPKPKRVFLWDKGGLNQPGKGKLISFEPTVETQEWTATLEAINAFYRQQDIGLGLSSDDMTQWLAARNDDPDRKGAPFRLPDLFKTDVYRVFNNGDVANPKFEEGGRLFGGWWMSAGEDLRKAITINGQPTVEIDYKECHPRMLYHRAGFNGDGELYILPEIAAYEAATGVKPGTYLPYVKWLTQVLINCKGRPGAVGKPDKILMPPDFTVKQIVGFIEDRHQSIAGDFRTGAGLDLMRIESDIALEIVSTAMAEGWTVLSVHDSFVTTINKKDRLKAMMTESYFKRLRREPSFKPISWSNGVKEMDQNKSP